MPEEVRGSFRSFEAAERHFRQKVNIPTRRWDDLWQGEHARAFVVAGATKESLLTDLREAVDAAISKGETLADFRKRFDDIVARNGWTGWKGEESAAGRAWRTQLIYHQNLRSSYMAGRWEQLQKFEFLRYNHHTVNNPREAHKAWNGKILRRDDPWWNTHYPPNGWGCRCDVSGISAARMRADGLQLDQAPPDVDPKAVPPAFRYNVGEAAHGKPVAKAILDAERGGQMVQLDDRGPEDFNRPARVPLDAPVASPIARVRDTQALRETFQRVVGGPAATFVDPSGGRVAVTDALIDHWLESPSRINGREQYLPLLKETIEQPYEIWAGFGRNELTGKIELRRRYVKGIDLGNGRVLGLVAESVQGQWIAWNFFSGGMTATNRLRVGFLVWGRE